MNRQLQLSRNGLSKNSFLFRWFPVLPFFGFWALSYFLFHFGLFVTPSLSAYTHIYIVLCLGLFGFSYYFGMLGLKRDLAVEVIDKEYFVLRILKATSFLAFLGTSTLVLDRVLTGAASVDVVLNQMYLVREEYVQRLSFLTTIAVIPHSFRLVAIAAYFYCGMMKIKIPGTVHFFIGGTVALEIINMIFSANRGVLYQIGIYTVFYVVFCKRINILRDVFSVSHLKAKMLFLMFILSAFFWFSFVAKERTVESTAIYLGKQATYLLRYPALSALDYNDLHVLRHLSAYVTGGLIYSEALLNYAIKHEDVLGFDLLGVLGPRVSAQVKKFYPDYAASIQKKLFDAKVSAGLSPSGWASIFGSSIAVFGEGGALLFFAVAGFFSGRVVQNYIATEGFAWLLLTFLICVSFSNSFDWILMNFDQYTAAGFAGYLLLRNSGSSFGRMNVPFHDSRYRVPRFDKQHTKLSR